MLTKNDLNEKLVREDFVDYWLGLTKEDVLESLGTEFANTFGFDQRNPHHCYTLYEHCVRTAGSIKVNNEMDLLLKVAALFHDIGKPFVAKEKDGRLVFYGHAKKSAQVMSELLPKFGFTKEECFYILFWIEHHDDFISFTDDETKSIGGGKVFISQSSVSKYLKKLKQKYASLPEESLNIMLEKLFMLCNADVSSQSEFTYRNGTLIDSRQSKVMRIEKIKAICFDLKSLSN